jgi:hypothetical protein
MKFSVSVTTATDTHLSSQTWLVSEEKSNQIRQYFVEQFGEPGAVQLIPLELADELVADNRHIAF